LEIFIEEGNMKQCVLFSIIIPHKNTPQLLERCLNSIPNREDIEIIIVDDNSDPTKVNFNNYPGINNERTTIVFSKEGNGAGYARNVGLQKAKGKWIIFADADDLFVKNAFVIFDSYADSDSKLIYFNMVGRYSENLEKEHWRTEYVAKLIRKYDGSLLSLNNLKYRCFGPCAKMYRKELITEHNLVFDEVTAGNDVMFSIKTAFYAKSSISVSKDTVYCATYREGSLTSTKNYSSYLCRYKIKLSANTFLKNHYLYEYQSPLLNYIVKSIRFGINKPFILTYLTIKSNNNPFTNLLKYFLKKVIP